LTHFAADDGAVITPFPVDHAIDERKIQRDVSDGADEEMMIAPTGKEEVHVLVVYLGTRDVLHLNPERRRDAARKWTDGDGALRRYHDGAGEEARESLELHLVRLLRSLEMDTPLDRLWSRLEAQPLALILRVARESARLVVRIVFIPSSPLCRCRSFSCEARRHGGSA